ncbi:MAG: hypothetical protein KF744_12090 [Taibaiella sp.]|nr:hypothetical protein [Taibaiella sp.]
MTELEKKGWVNTAPGEILVHGPSKIYIDRYWWFEPEEGLISSYKVQPKDVADHFDVFRGVDIIESAGQTGVSACAIRESVKQEKSIDELKKHFRIAFLGMGEARFHGFVRVHETLVSICSINRYKFRQMHVSCKVYKVPADKDVAASLSELKQNKIVDIKLPAEYELVAELSDIIGRAVPINKIYTN